MVFCTISYLVFNWAVKSLPYNESWIDEKGVSHKVHIEKETVNSYYRITDGKHTMTYSVDCSKNRK